MFSSFFFHLREIIASCQSFDFFSETVTIKSKPKHMNDILLIGIAGAHGTGKTTLAKALAKNNNGIYYSVHKHLLSTDFFKKHNKKVFDRLEFTALANQFCEEKKDPTIAIKGIIDIIRANHTPDKHIYVIESIFRPAEIDYLENLSNQRITVLLLGITAFPDDRFEWISKNSNRLFSPLKEKNGAIMYALESSTETNAAEHEVNTELCIEKIRKKDEKFVFENEGKNCIKTIILPKAQRLLDEIINPSLHE
jgi:hypothetical protein